MDNLSDLLWRINRHKNSGKLSADERDDIGQALDKVQNLLPRGGFGPWIAQNLWFSYGMASYYMKCYRDNQVAAKYKAAAESHAKGPEAFEQEAKAMGSEDYRKLVQYMRDNLELTNKIKAMEVTFQRQRDSLYKQLTARDAQIMQLTQDLRDERMNGGGNPFGNLFGGATQTLTKEEYRILMSAIHPDKAMSEEQREKFNKVSQIINRKMKA